MFSAPNRTPCRPPAETPRPLKWKILVCLLGGTFIIVGAGWVHGVSSSAADPLRLTNERALFIAPHPDDESLACGGAIKRALREAGSVEVIWLNDGDANPTAARLLNLGRQPDAAAFRRLGEVRHREVNQAADDLGVPWRTTWLLRSLIFTRRLSSIPTRPINTMIIGLPPDSSHKLLSGWITRQKLYYLTHFGWNWPWPSLFDPLGSIRSPNDRMSADRKTVVLSLPWADENDKLVALGRYESQGAYWRLQSERLCG